MRTCSANLVLVELIGSSDYLLNIMVLISGLLSRWDYPYRNQSDQR